jgi:hypothetical protein
MAPRRSLSRSERRAADRPATRGRELSDELIALAQAKILTRSNTRAGTVGRQAANAVIYRRRVERGRRLGASTARAGVGHGGPLPPAQMSAIFREVGFAIVEDPTIAERARIARWNSRAGELRDGEISPTRFAHLVSSWAPVREMRFEWDASVVLANQDARRQSGEELFIYEGRRA